MMSLLAFVIILAFIGGALIIGVWGERKIAGFIQDRLGPTEVGYKGLLQMVADGIKLLQKEDLVPKGADKFLFLIAPIVIFVGTFAGFATIPMANGIIGSSAQTGVYFVLAIVSLDVIGFLLAGWSSNNKFSLLGAMRAVAQIISYEIPVGMLVLAVVMISQSLDLQEICIQQGILTTQSNYLFGIKALDIDITNTGGILTWNIFRYPLLLPGLILFFIATLAESNRAPFDIPEADSEIVAGFQTEYSGFRWSVLMLAEYTMMILVGFLGVILFLGGWNTPLPNIVGVIDLATITTGTSGEWSGYIWSLFWLIGKVCCWLFVQMWVRWTYPRLRIDQLMYLCWKVIFPASILIVWIAGVWRMLMI